MTCWYPSTRFPFAGSFVRRDALLISRRHDVHVLHLVHGDDGGPDPANAADALRVTRVAMPTAPPIGPFLAAGAVGAALHGADLVHTQAFPALYPFALRRPRLPWVHSEHWSGIGDTRGLPWRGRLAVGATGRLLDRPDVVTAVSEHLAERVRHFRRGPVHVVPSVVEPATLTPRPSGRVIELVAVGGLGAGKDPALARDTVRTLHQRGFPARLTWVGDGPLRADLEATAQPDDQVRFVGSRDASGVAESLDAADIFLLPTRGETLCLSALEAITHGRPVVLGARGGQREYVTRENGRLVAARSADAYADAVLEVWDQRNEIVPSRVAATIGDRFTPDRVREGYDRAYRCAIEAADRRGGPSR